MVELAWEPPGEGVWWLAREHLPVPVSRLFASVFPPTTDGWTLGAATYGIPLGRARWGAVNGWLYYGPPGPSDPASYPALEATARVTIDRARWRDEVTRWLEDERPPIVAKNRELQSVSPARLDDRALGAYVTNTIAHFHDVAPLHFAHVGFDFAGGLLVLAGREWGLDGAEIVAALAGASPASAATLAHIDAIAAELDAPPRSSDELAGPALDAYLDEYGWRMLGRDLNEPTLAEQPELVVASVRARMTAPASPRDDPIDALRERVPAAARDRFDSLLADARASYQLRDDDVGVCFNWPLGLLRRACLEIAARAGLPDGRLVFETDSRELLSLLRGRGPSVDELRHRVAIREAATVADPPLQLGTPVPPEPVPPVPPAVAKLLGARNAIWSVDVKPGDGALRGTGIGSEIVRGRARLIDDPDAVGLLEPGDVIVATATMAAHNAIFPIAAAVVTREGGLLSHAAILSRELGLPAVVGVADVFEHVGDGDEIEVDPAQGVVRVLRRRE